MAFWNRKEERGEGVTADVLFASMKKDRISAEDAMNIPAAARCVNMIASAVASLPVKLYEKTENDIREVTDDPRVELLNNRTGDTVNASEMRIRWVMDYLLLGNAYAYIDRDIYNRVKRIVYISPSAISVRANRSDPINKIFSYTVSGREIYPYQMLKLLRHTDGYGKGIGIIHENAVILSVAYNTMNFEKNMVKKGGNKRGFLKSQKTLSRDAMTALRENWNKLYTSDGDSCLILNDGMDFKEASNTSVEMQLNENKKLNGGDIMTLFGTADGILSDDTVKNAVMPVLDAFEAAFDADLLDEAEKEMRYFAFDTRELTRGNIQQRYNAYAVALQNNFMQLDEIRKEEDLPPLGINFIRLGLNDVLLNPKSNMVYTPNTNSWAKLGVQSVEDGGAGVEPPVDKSENDDIIDVRGREIRKPNGQFNGSMPSAEAELRAKIESGEFPTKLDKEKQGRHVIGNPAYEKRIANGEFPSYITVSKMKIQEIINSKSLTGKVHKLKDGQYQELITADEDFGVFCSLVTHEKIKTNRGVIHYSKDGTHLVPTYPEGKIYE